MDNTGEPCTYPTSMRSPAPIAVAFREVRHFMPDDCMHCEPIGVRGVLHGWSIPAHRHEGLHQFQLIERGGVEATLDGMDHRLAAPAALMIAPGTVHAFRYQPGSAGCQVTVPTALLKSAFSTAPALSGLLDLPLVIGAIGLAADAGCAAGLFGSLSAEFERAEPGRTEALRAHAVLLATWFLRHASAGERAHARQAVRDTLVQRYRALLELHFRQQHALPFFASALQVTPDHLSRICRTVTGRPALDMLHERLVREARRLLATTDATIADIAQDLGFADAAYFSRLFSKRTGQPPLAYRQSLRQGRAVPPEA